MTGKIYADVFSYVQICMLKFINGLELETVSESFVTIIITQYRMSYLYNTKFPINTSIFIVLK